MIVTAAVIGAALAADAFAVSVVCGAGDKTRKFTVAVLTAGTFALFQMLMPVAGWSIGRVGCRAVEGFDHIFAFGILIFLGIKMMLDSRSDGNDKRTVPFSARSLLLLALATSIDALTVGIALPSAAGVSNLSGLILSVSVIGGITFMICLAGYLAGRKLRSLDPQAALIAGGVVLIIVGIRTLLAG